MPTKQIRSNKYYEASLRTRRPDIHADFVSGRYPSLAKALIAAGIKKPRTRLAELKNAWTNATASEQADFVRWIATQTSSMTLAQTVASPAAGPIARNGHLEPLAADRIKTVIAKRRLSMGEVMDELGFKRQDGSLGNALRNQWKLQPSILAALELWLQTNRNV